MAIDIYIYIYISQQPDLGTLLVTTGLHGSVGGLLGSFSRFWTWIDASGGLFWPSVIIKTGLGSQKHHPRSIFIDFTNICKRKYVIWMIFYEFPWFRGYEKDGKRNLESIGPRILAWALFWTCLVKETMFSNIDNYLCIYLSIHPSI